MPPSVKYSKEKILEVALELVLTKGIESISARNIAKELNCSICPVFSYFNNMDVLKKEVLDCIFEIYKDYIKEGIENSKIPFKSAGIHYIKFAKEYSNYFKALFMSKTESSAVELLNFDTDNNEVMEKSISCEENVRKKVHMYCWLFVHGIAVMEAAGYCSFSDDELSEMLTFEYQSILASVKGE